jgi:hypothetical protein
MKSLIGIICLAMGIFIVTGDLILINCVFITNSEPPAIIRQNTGFLLGSSCSSGPTWPEFKQEHVVLKKIDVVLSLFMGLLFSMVGFLAVYVKLGLLKYRGSGQSPPWYLLKPVLITIIIHISIFILALLMMWSRHPAKLPIY